MLYVKLHININAIENSESILDISTLSVSVNIYHAKKCMSILGIFRKIFVRKLGISVLILIAIQISRYRGIIKEEYLVYENGNCRLNVSNTLSFVQLT